MKKFNYWPLTIFTLVNIFVWWKSIEVYLEDFDYVVDLNQFFFLINCYIIAGDKRVLNIRTVCSSRVSQCQTK